MGFPNAVKLGGNRIGFFESEVEAWLRDRPRIVTPEVNDNRRTVYCPATTQDLEKMWQDDYIKLKANNWETNND